MLENSAAGTVVGDLRVVDQDKPEQQFTYQLLDDAMGRFKISAGQLVVAKSQYMCGPKVITFF